MVAAVQAAPVYLNREATVERVGELAAKAAADGAELIVFPEAFVPGYPEWVWRLPPWRDRALVDRLVEESVEVPGPATRALGEVAAQLGVWLVVGVNERCTTSSTLYNSLLYLAPDGSVAARHRKLMPTGGERTVWGFGDGSSLRAVPTPFGRLSGLICWENYMPLARAAVWSDRPDIHLAPTWDNNDAWVPTLRHIAREGRVFVIGTNTCVRGADLPAAVTGAVPGVYGGEDDWLSRGNTAIVGPDGAVLAGPLVAETGILLAEIDVSAARRARREFDPVGHYARPDVFRLEVSAVGDGNGGQPVVRAQPVFQSPIFGGAAPRPTDQLVVPSLPGRSTSPRSV